MKINLQASTKEEYFEKFLIIISALSPTVKQITPLEIELLARFMALPEVHKYYPFSPKARKIVNNSLPRPHTIQNLSIKICSLIDKNYLVRDEDNFIDFSPTIKQIVNSLTLDVTLQLRPASKENSKVNPPSSGSSGTGNSSHV